MLPMYLNWGACNKSIRFLRTSIQTYQHTPKKILKASPDISSTGKNM